MHVYVNLHYFAVSETLLERKTWLQQLNKTVSKSCEKSSRHCHVLKGTSDVTSKQL